MCLGVCFFIPSPKCFSFCWPLYFCSHNSLNFLIFIIFVNSIGEKNFLQLPFSLKKLWFKHIKYVNYFSCFLFSLARNCWLGIFLQNSKRRKCWEECRLWIQNCLCLRSIGFWHSLGDIRAMQDWQTAVKRHQEDSEAELNQILPCQTSSKLPCWQLAKVGDRCNSDLWNSMQILVPRLLIQTLERKQLQGLVSYCKFPVVKEEYICMYFRDNS